MRRKSKRVSIKIGRDVFDVLRQIRKDTGAPITVIMARAVDAYAHPRPGQLRKRVSKLRGSR